MFSIYLVVTLVGSKCWHCYICWPFLLYNMTFVSLWTLCYRPRTLVLESRVWPKNWRMSTSSLIRRPLRHWSVLCSKMKVYSFRRSCLSHQRLQKRINCLPFSHSWYFNYPFLNLKGSKTTTDCFFLSFRQKHDSITRLIIFFFFTELNHLFLSNLSFHWYT